ncbi:MAG: hypothetical protein L6R36_005498 [Xanthoria steineri]|nr:MAG: hypothetical protein L6R36_005498 [Xanthoria steineri]
MDSRPATPEEVVVGKVLRRVEIAKMARKLHDRLALASYKTQHGLDNLSPNLVEAHLESTLKRKRPGSSISTSSDTSSTASDQPFFSGGLNSSPRTAAMFSDDVHPNVTTIALGKKSARGPTFTLADTSSTSRKRNLNHSIAPPLGDTSRVSWKSAHNLPQSSPSFHQHPHFSRSQAPNLSFTSEASTVPNTPPFGSVSDDEAHEPLDPPFDLTSSHFHSSPPCTPPPTRSRKSRNRRRNAAGEEGAELLMHLATSPSPANGGLNHKFHPPSTPPSNHQALPSSVMSNSGPSGFLAGFSTPGQSFAWADFINVTPSPAQGAFGSRTPGLPKTPLAAKEARRRLNLDSLAAAGGSPNLTIAGRGSTARDTGLGMELGGELVS